MNVGDEAAIARLLRLLQPPPPGWVEAAQELPEARAAVDELVARASEDAAARAQLLAELESALAANGVQLEASIVKALRTLLGDE